MSQNQNIIPILFEEIKEILHKIIQKLDNLQNTSKPTEINHPTDDAKFKRLEQQIQQIPKPDMERIERGQSAITQNCKVLFNTITQQDEKLKEILDRLEQQPTQRPVQKHLHTIDIKSSKVVVTIIGLSLFLFFSFVGNIYQWKENAKLSNNDIKYRYIKICDGIDSKTLHKLETIFEYEPDKAKQKSLRQAIEDFERRERERAAELERARLKEEEANQLLKQAEKLKGKK